MIIDYHNRYKFIIIRDITKYPTPLTSFSQIILKTKLLI